MKTAYIFTVELGSKWVVDINDDELPVSFTLIEQSHNTKDLDLLDLTRVSNLLTDFADINRIVVTLGLGLSMNLVRVFPGLGKSTVIPDVTLVGEAVTDITKLALLNVLFNWVESIFLGNLLPKMKRLFRTLSAIQSSFFFSLARLSHIFYLKLCVGPTGDLDDHVEDSLLSVSEKRDIMEWRNGSTVLFCRWR